MPAVIASYLAALRVERAMRNREGERRSFAARYALRSGGQRFLERSAALVGLVAEDLAAAGAGDDVRLSGE